MAYEYSELLAQAQVWASDAIAQGYLKQSDAQALLMLDQRSPEQLFATDNSACRPLIVAFIGGTGVGKSSLLNRLAGQAVAKSGVERPTSREVTLYHHQSLHLQHLPGSLPLEKPASVSMTIRKTFISSGLICRILTAWSKLTKR
jgi:GTPase SAR1 family protein